MVSTVKVLKKNRIIGDCVLVWFPSGILLTYSMEQSPS